MMGVMMRNDVDEGILILAGAWSLWCLSFHYEVIDKILYGG